MNGKAAIFLVVLTILILTDGKRHHKKHHKDQTNFQKARNLERFLKNAMSKYHLASKGSPRSHSKYSAILGNRDDSAEGNTSWISRQTVEGRVNEVKTPTRHVIKVKIDKIPTEIARERSKPYQDMTRMDKTVKATSKSGVIPWYRNINMEHRPATTSTTRKSTIKPSTSTSTSPSWKFLKSLVRKEFLKDYAKLQQMKRKEMLRKYSYDDNKDGEWIAVNKGDDDKDADDDNGKPPAEETLTLAKNPTFSMADGRNLEVFALGFGSAVMLFALFILGYHCVRYIRFKDGLFAKKNSKANQPSKSMCTNNNNQAGNGGFLERREEFWSSEEEVFNISMPRSFNDSPPRSPIVNKSLTLHSTPIKTKNTPLK